MTSHEIRQEFLDYFARNGHRVVPSSSLVPAGDPTLLFINAGMNQFKDVFLGKERRDYRRATTAQKCMRVSGKHNDLDNVGPSLRHHTFFEMLGNFSFGDYFKEAAIAFAWELLTQVWCLPPDRLFATVFAGDAGIPRDEEAYGHWRRFVPADRIAELGLADNFWAMGDTGPCGRCSEVHFFRGDHIACPEPTCLGVACGCDRFVEIWNNVFMEFDRQPGGALEPLPAPSIDTGMGLERVTAVIQGTLSNYDTDLFTPLLHAIANTTGKAYGRDPATDVSMRVVADHIRATTFLVGDGVVPSNEWRGYVLRKIMRRAMRHGKKLGTREPFLHRLVDVLIGEMGDIYPELPAGREFIVRIVRGEEDRFDAVLNAGLPRLEETIERAAAQQAPIPGDEIFLLYDSLGIPVDFIEDLAAQRGVALDQAGFERAMSGQREKARAASSFKRVQDVAWVTKGGDERRLDGAGDDFKGYETTSVKDARILALFRQQGDKAEEVDELRAGQTGFVALSSTPFYVESGGQVSDLGRLCNGAEAQVDALVRVGRWPRLHHVEVRSGILRSGSLVTATVDERLRDATRRNHTATHLLHAALRRVLGPHVKQAGSLVAPDRLRFDFVHFAALTGDEIATIERLVNEEIVRNTAVETEVRSTHDAIAAGAMALFGEKYGERVRVVRVPGFSMELCGGTHCRATGDIGLFVITGESGIAAGVRRIEALTGAGALDRYQQQRGTVDRITEALNTTSDQAPEAIQRLQAETRRLARENEQLRMKAAMGGGGRAGYEIAEVGGVRLVAQQVAGLEKTGLRTLADTIKDQIKSGVVVLVSSSDAKVAIVVAVTPDLRDRLPAGKIVQRIAPIVGGGGGGRSDFAEAGGKDPSKIGDLLSAAPAVVAELLARSA